MCNRKREREERHMLPFSGVLCCLEALPSLGVLCCLEVAAFVRRLARPLPQVVEVAAQVFSRTLPLPNSTTHPKMAVLPNSTTHPKISAREKTCDARRPQVNNLACPRLARESLLTCGDFHTAQHTQKSRGIHAHT